MRLTSLQIPSTICPPLIYTLFALYVPSFISSYLTQPQYNVIADEVDVTVTDIPVNTEEPEVLPSTAAHTEHGTLGTTDNEPDAVLEEVEIEETMLLEERSPKFWRTLLTGMPSDRKSVV